MSKKRIAISAGRTQIKRFSDLCKKSGITMSCAINIAVHKIANENEDMFILKPVIKDTGEMASRNVTVDEDIYKKCCDVCAARGVTPMTLIRAYIAKCVNEQIVSAVVGQQAGKTG